MNWFTVAAQIVNFLILVALLKYFLYDRIIRAMDEREKTVRSRMQEADEKEAEARREADELSSRRRELEQEKEGMIATARGEAEKEKKELLRRAREEVDAQHERWEAALRREQEAFLRDFQQMAAREVYAAARRAIGDLAGMDLEGAIVENFIKRLQGLDAGETGDMAWATTDSGRGLTIRSHFELPSEAKRKLTAALHKQLDRKLDVRYESAPEMLPGIEVRGAGRKMAWSAGSYLDGLEDRALGALSRAASGEATTETASEGEPSS